MAKTVLDVRKLTKRFGPAKAGFAAVDNVSFSIREGEIVGLLGINGAGKTTTTQMLLGTLTPTSGTIRYFDKDFSVHRSEVMESVGYASAYSRLPWRMTVRENLDVFARMFNVADRQQKILSLLAQFEIGDLIDKQFSSLSSGQETRVLLCKAFLHSPKILLLDEPTASLDPDIAAKVREYLLKQQQEKRTSMLFTSHNMAEVEEVCDRVLFISHGRIVAEDTPEGLAGRMTRTQVRLMVRDGMKRTLEFSKKHKFPARQEGRYVTVSVNEDDIAPFLSFLAERGIVYQEISIDRPTLEDFFLEMARKDDV